MVVTIRHQDADKERLSVCVHVCVCECVWADAHRTGGHDGALLGYGHRLECTRWRMTPNNPVRTSQYTHTHTEKHNHLAHLNNSLPNVSSPTAVP